MIPSMGVGRGSRGWSNPFLPDHAGQGIPYYTLPGASRTPYQPRALPTLWAQSAWCQQVSNPVYPILLSVWPPLGALRGRQGHDIMGLSWWKSDSTILDLTNGRIKAQDVRSTHIPSHQALMGHERHRACGPSSYQALEGVGRWQGGFSAPPCFDGSSGDWKRR